MSIIISTVYGQPPEIYGSLGAIAFVIFIFLAIYEGMTSPRYIQYRIKQKKFSDWIEIARFDDGNKPEPNKQNTSILNDCILALVAIGYSKTEAKKTANQVFESNQVESVEDFIVKAMKKND